MILYTSLIFYLLLIKYYLHINIFSQGQIISRFIKILDTDIH